MAQPACLATGRRHSGPATLGALLAASRATRRKVSSRFTADALPELRMLANGGIGAELQKFPSEARQRGRRTAPPSSGRRTNSTGSYSTRRGSSAFVNPELSPMWVMPVPVFLGLKDFVPHQTAMDQGRLQLAEEGDTVIFVSHQWLDEAAPDPDRVQLRELQRVLSAIIDEQSADIFSPSDWELFAAGAARQFSELSKRQFGVAEARQGAREVTHESFADDIANAYIWMDYFSVPQVVPGAHEGALILTEQMRAIKSIPSYIERCAYFFIVAPPAPRPAERALSSFDAWRSRGWCRVELWTHFLSLSQVHPLVLTGRKEVAVMDLLEIVGVAANRNIFGPCCGDFTCCKQGHTKAGGRCDALLCHGLLEEMFMQKIKELESSGQFMRRCMLLILETTLLAKSVEAPYRPKTCEVGTPEMRLQAFKKTRHCAELGDPSLVLLHTVTADAELARMLFEEGFRADTVNSIGHSVPWALSGFGCSDALRLVLEHPTCSAEAVNLGTRNNITPLGRAARCGHLRNVQLLLEHRGDVHSARKDNGFTPLHNSAFNGHAEVAEALIEARADINARCLKGQTALHLCATGLTLFGSQCGKARTVELLLRERALVEVRDVDQRTALDVALIEGNVQVAELLEKFNMSAN